MCRSIRASSLRFPLTALLLRLLRLLLQPLLLPCLRPLLLLSLKEGDVWAKCKRILVFFYF